ncbi:uncharacterized protein DFL_006957 [Arthrobotrys flagrans]|uniref:Yippee domain-containing protein n=1 Tax=Arthrobotrys flagrans TaxID=97331 RepID=A0A436ZU99_ARTFL|nr:hypothetical protein DFL_006957 [Arthrobotrys flagrans]
MTNSLNFPRFLLPAFPRWESSLLKRHRPVEDVTASPTTSGSLGRRRSSNTPTTSDNNISDNLSSSEDEGRDMPARRSRNLSHDSGCMVSDEDCEEDEVEGEEESSDENDRAYTYAPSKGRYSSSVDSLEIYLDTESGYGGSSDELTNTTSATEKKFAFWPSKPRQNPSLPPPPKPTLSTTTTYLNCSTCRTNLCFSSSVISKGFTGRHGRAYLVSSLLPSNIIHGKPTSRALQTGAHTVSDISCKICGSNLGWKYIHAEERGQRYKIGKYILETGRVGKVNYWDGKVDDGLDEDGRRESEKGHGDGKVGWEPGWEDLGDDEAEVDLADEEELEAMFAGSWNKEKALRRRERRRVAEEARRKVDSNV